MSSAQLTLIAHGGNPSPKTGPRTDTWYQYWQLRRRGGMFIPSLSIVSQDSWYNYAHTVMFGHGMAQWPPKFAVQTQETQDKKDKNERKVRGEKLIQALSSSRHVREVPPRPVCCQVGGTGKERMMVCSHHSGAKEPARTPELGTHGGTLRRRRQPRFQSWGYSSWTKPSVSRKH